MWVVFASTEWLNSVNSAIAVVKKNSNPPCRKDRTELSDLDHTKSAVVNELSLASSRIRLSMGAQTNKDRAIAAQLLDLRVANLSL